LNQLTVTSATLEYLHAAARACRRTRVVTQCACFLLVASSVYFGYEANLTASVLCASIAVLLAIFVPERCTDEQFTALEGDRCIEMEALANEHEDVRFMLKDINAQGRQIVGFDLSRAQAFAVQQLRERQRELAARACRRINGLEE
jgi:hypothetical protein